MSRIVVDLERLKYLHCGLGQFSLHLGQALLATSPSDLAMTFLVPPGGESLFAPATVDTIAATTWRREAVQRIFRPIVAGWSRQAEFDLWHVTHQDSRFWPLDPRVPVVLTIHDLNFLRTKSPRVIRRRLRGLQSKIDRATVLTTGSHHAAQEIRAHLQTRGKAIRVIPHGVCLDQHEEPTRPIGVPDQSRFLFSIGDIRPSKNFHVLVDMLRNLPDLALVVAGSTKDSYAEQIRRRAAELGLADRVCLPGRVTEGERVWLYRHCAALVFPSLAEGFGLPLIEAMSCGRPVFSSRCTSLPEVGGPLAFYWNSFEPTAMADVVRDGLQRFAADTTYAEQLRDWAATFSWPRAADQYFGLYREVLGVGV